MGEKRDVYRVMVRIPEGQGALGRTRRKLEDNIKIDLWYVEVWTGSSWLRIETGGGNLCIR